jgi:LytS/YehU family sensor histidine kinase
LFPAITFATLKSNILGGLTITYLVIAIHEGMNFYKGWKANLERSQSLAREKAEMQLALVDAQLSALRDQLDPHFLFNSLNTLSSLIDLKNEKAIAYLEQLADVYRYVLENREKHLVPLSEEIAFANAYMNLVKTRFRDDLIFDVKPDRITTEACLPPYALQLLLENAIKHNAIAEDSPLRIKVTCEPGCLVVSNNRQPKKTLASSTRLGLSNLQHRCRLTTQKPLVILESTDAFTVKVPLVTSPYSKVTNDNQSVASYAHHNH